MIPKFRGSLPLTVLILFQSACCLFFMSDVISDLAAGGWTAVSDLHLLPEFAASFGLVVGILYEARVLIRMLRKQAHLEQSLGVAAGALADLMENYFSQWALTPSEQDVAAFTIKGYSIAEIADLRGSREATIKTHLNAIYRKSGVSGRGQLVSLLIEDLLNAPLVTRTSGGEVVATGG
jgi:DNA-binding CsgD family transcriptional regulator